MSSTYSSYDKVLSLDWNGKVFVLTLRNEITNAYSYKYSNDGNTWTDMSFSTNLSANNPYVVKWVGSKFLVGGDISETQTLSTGDIVNKKSILSSTDGKVFSVSNMNADMKIYDIESNLEFRNSICFPQNMYLALGGGNSVKIASSKDQGVSWVNSSNSGAVFQTAAYHAVTNGKMWVAVGEGGNTIATSLDGSKWLGRGDYVFSTAAKSIDWSKELHTFVAVGSGGNTIAHSKDGIHWLGSNSVFNQGLDVKWNGSLWVAGGTPKTGTESIAHSTDGITWTPVNAFTTSCKKLAWNGSVWTAIGDTNKYAQSVDGIYWNIVSDASLSSVSSLFSGDGNIIIGTDTTLYKIEDNNFATKQVISSGYKYNGGVYSNNTYSLALGDSSNIGLTHNLVNYSYISTDLSFTNSIVANNNEGVATIMPLTIACGEGANTLGYSYDGIRWVGSGKSIFTTRANKACWNGKTWLAVGAGTHGWLASSRDGIAWESVSTTILDEGYDIAWNGQVWVAVGVGASATIVRSVDGLTWTPVSNSSTLFTTRASSILWTGKAWLAYGSGTNTSAMSSNGDASVWTTTPSKNIPITDASNVFAEDGFMSANTQGDYVASASSEQSGYEAWYAFDGSFNTANTMWKSGTLYDTTTGIYNGSETTTYNTSLSVTGEWLQIKLAESREVKYMYPVFKISSGTNIPRSWCVLGSNNGTSWTLIDASFEFSPSSPPNNSWKHDSLVLPIHLNNSAAYQYYRMVFPKSFGGTNVEITSLQLYVDNSASTTINRYLKPILTRDILLHPSYLVNYDGVNKHYCVYSMTDLDLNPIKDAYIHGHYLNTALYGVDEGFITSHAFDGNHLLVSANNGSLTSMTNEAAITTNNFDDMFQSQQINSNMGVVYSLAWNRNYFVAGGNTGITYGTLNEASVPTWYNTNAGTLFSNVFSVDSNSNYGYVYSPNAMYFNQREKLSIISPKTYSVSSVGTTSITMNLYNK